MAADEDRTSTLSVTPVLKSATNDAANDAPIDKLLITINAIAMIMIITLRTLRGGP